MKKIKEVFRRIEWVNFFFITLTPVVAIAGTSWAVSQGGIFWQTLLLLFCMMMLTGIGITAGYHRLFTHCSYKAHWSVKLLLLLLGGAAFEGSAREWCNAHRKHHRHVDDERDPYNIQKGFWHAHVFWVVLKNPDQADESYIPDLIRDPLVRFQNRYYIVLATTVGLLLPTALAAFWSDPWGGLFIAGFVRIVINHHLTFFINSLCHFVGKQTYSDKDSSRDSWLMALFTYGEGFHNFHHAFQTDYRNGIRAYHWDPGKWFISFFAKLGLAWNLHRVDPERILKAKLAMDEKRIRARLARRAALNAEWEEIVAKTRENIEQLHVRLQELRVQYRQLKQKNLRHEMKRLQREFKEALSEWHMILKTLSAAP